jgi:hypothetical protein
LKKHVKIHCSRPFCWYFCWYRENKCSRRISLFPNEGIEQIACKNDDASANTNTSTAAPPDRNMNGQTIANVFDAGVTEPYDVTCVFKSFALRFDAPTIPHPSIVNEMWSKVDWDAERWTLPAAKMKTGWDHVVPLSRQALAMLRSVQKLTGHRRYAFSCSKDAPLSNNTLNRRLRLLGIDTKTDHCAHGFRTTYSSCLTTKRSRTPRRGMAMSSSCSSRISIIRLWKGSTRSTGRLRWKHHGTNRNSRCRAIHWFAATANDRIQW